MLELSNIILMNNLMPNVVVPFIFKNSGIRGRVAKFSSTINDILAKHQYPQAISKVLGELVILASVIGDMTAKLDNGITTLQVNAEGILDLLVADYFAQGKTRGYARFNKDLYDKLLEKNASPGFSELVTAGHLTLTLDNTINLGRYQGIVELTGQSLAACIEEYFKRSEQLETVARVAVGPNTQGVWSGGCIIIQLLPQALPNVDIDDLWEEAAIFTKSVSDQELIDQKISTELLLHRLFHQHEIVAYESREVIHGCRCSREKASNILATIPKEEQESLKIDGKIIVTCEFCSKSEIF